MIGQSARGSRECAQGVEIDHPCRGSVVLSAVRRRLFFFSTSYAGPRNPVQVPQNGEDGT